MVEGQIDEPIGVRFHPERCAVAGIGGSGKQALIPAGWSREPRHHENRQIGNPWNSITRTIIKRNANWDHNAVWGNAK